MIGSQLPGLNGYFTNSLALNRELGRAIGFVQVARSNTGKEPASTEKLVALLDAAKALVQAGAITAINFSAGFPATITRAVGASLSLPAVVAAGGSGPYTYVYRKGATVLDFSGPGPHVVNATAVTGDSGTYTVTVSDRFGYSAVSTTTVTVS